MARHDVHNNYFSSNLGIACGLRQYPRQFSNLDILTDFDASNMTLVVLNAYVDVDVEVWSRF